MSTDSKNANKKPLERATEAETSRAKVTLRDLAFDTDRYYHRETEDLGEKRLEGLLKSLTLEGLLVPVEFSADQKGRKVVINGHRRVAACRILAARNVPGFNDSMELEALEVRNATPQDLLVRSVADNEVRLSLDRVGRIRVARKLHDAGVQVDRAAFALGVSVKTYERDLLIAQHPWMYQHVIDDSINPTPAQALLAKARDAGRLRELKEDLDAWVAREKQNIRERERISKLKHNKELRPADRMVKKLLPAHLVTHWLELLGKNRRFDEDAQWTFAAAIEDKKDLLHISSVTLNLRQVPLDRLAQVASKLSLLTKQLRPVIQQRHQEERNVAVRGASASPYDLDYLREMGLDDVAKDLEGRLTSGAEEDGVEDGGRDVPESRPERDLTEDIGLPGGAADAPASREESPESATPPEEGGA
jgi:ParB-like chromosome segregation protein Spo0J